MNAEAGQLYHLYNQGNNKELLFAKDQDYLAFLRLTRRHLSPVCEIVAWCLMPNHFHFCIYAMEESVREIRSGSFMIQQLSRGVGDLLSHYSAELNGAQNRTGARFRPRTKLKQISESGDVRYVTAVQYIHDNPVAAGLCLNACDWTYSSAKEYSGLRNGTLCNLQLARELGLLCS